MASVRINIGVSGRGNDGIEPVRFNPDKVAKILDALIVEAVRQLVDVAQCDDIEIWLYTRHIDCGVPGLALRLGQSYQFITVGIVTAEDRFDRTEDLPPVRDTRVVAPDKIREELVDSCDVLIALGADPVTVADAEAFEAAGGTVLAFDFQTSEAYWRD